MKSSIDPDLILNLLKCINHDDPLTRPDFLGGNMALGGVANPSFPKFSPHPCQGSIVRAWRMKLDPENRALAQPVKLLVDGLDDGNIPVEQ